MPSEDKFHSERPEVNDWLERDEHGSLRPKPGTTLASYRTSKDARAFAKQAAHLQLLARELGLDPEALAEKISPDNLRRLKFPMIVGRTPEGLWTFEHDLGIVEGVRPNLGTDRGQVSHPLQEAPRPRDASGRYIK